jgi:hypothetical protein
VTMEWPFDYPAFVVEADTSVIYCLDLNLAITYCNPAWDRFAMENGAKELCRPAVNWAQHPGVYQRSATQLLLQDVQTSVDSGRTLGTRV